MSKSPRRVVSVAGFLLSSAFAIPAFAQQPPQPRPTSSSDEVDDQLIIVTARKREESIQDVPGSVQVVDEAQLDNYNLEQVVDLTNKLPNFIMPTATFPSLTDVSVRGVNVAVRNAGFNPSVSFYVDGVYQGRPSNFNQTLLDVERVELLLGPQATLFGNNTIAGVVNIITRPPGRDFGGYVRLGVGNYDLYEVRASINIPISEQFSVRLSGVRQERDGFQRNLFTGRDQGNLNRGAARAQILFDVASTRILASVGYQSSAERLATREYVQPGASPIPAVPPLDNGFNAAPEPFEYLQDPSYGEWDRFDAALNVRQRLSSNLSLVSITGYKHARTFDRFDQDFAADPRLRSDVDNDEEQLLFSQELRLESNPELPFSYLIGMYFLRDEVTLERDYYFRPPFVALGRLGAFGLQIETLSRLKTDTFSMFGNVEYDIMPGLELSVGLRYTTEHMSTSWDQRELFSAQGLPTNQVLPLGPLRGILVPTAPIYLDERSDRLWSGTATLTYHFDEARMVYARYARGTKSGGFNLEPLPSPLPPDRSFDNETLDNYELGVRSQWWNGRLVLNVTGFLQRYHDLQRADVIPIEVAPGVNALTRVIRNAAEVEAMGVEVSARLAPVRGLSITGSYGFSNARFTDYTTLAGVDLTGQPLSGVPKWNANIAMSYSFNPGSNLRVTAGVAADFRGRRRLGFADANAVEIEGYELINAHLTLGSANNRWSVNFWVNNLADSRYVTDRGTGTDFYRAELVAYGLPRMFGASLTFRFGS